jgi:hypothetical protein
MTRDVLGGDVDQEVLLVLPLDDRAVGLEAAVCDDARPVLALDDHLGLLQRSRGIALGLIGHGLRPGPRPLHIVVDHVVR